MGRWVSPGSVRRSLAPSRGTVTRTDAILAGDPLEIAVHNEDAAAHPALDARLDILEAASSGQNEAVFVVEEQAGATYGDQLTAAITAAAAVKGKVYLGRGTKTLPSTGWFYVTPISDIEIFGAGWGQTTLQLPAGANSSIYGMYLQDLTNIKLRDFTIDGNKANQGAATGQRGFSAAACNDLNLIDIEVKNTTAEGIFLYQSPNHRIVRPRLREIGKGSWDAPADRTVDGTKSAIQIYGHPGGTGTTRGNSWIEDADIDGCCDMGIAYGGYLTHDCTIVNPHIRRVHYIGIGVGGMARQVVIDGAIIGEVTGNAIDTGGSEDCVVSNFVFYNCESGLIPDGTGATPVNHNYGPGVMRNMVSPDAEADADYISNGAALGLFGGPSTKRLYTAHDILIDGCAGDGVGVIDSEHCSLTNIIVRNPGMASTRFSNRVGFRLYSPDVVGPPAYSYTIRHLQMHGCRAYDDRGTALMDYALSFNGPAANITDCMVTENDFEDTGAVIDAIEYTGGSTYNTVGTVARNPRDTENLVTVTTTYTAGRNDGIIFADAAGGAFTITLPPAADRTGERIAIQRTNATNNVTVDGSGGEFIDQNLTQRLDTQYAFIEMISYGTGWLITSQRGTITPI